MSDGRSRLGCVGWTVVAALVVTVILVVVFAWIVPSQRKSYSIDSLRIQDAVLTDGSLSTVETFGYTFHGRFTRVYRDIPWDGHELTVTGVTGPAGPLKRLPSAWTPDAGAPVAVDPGADPTPAPWTSIAPEERPAGYYRVTTGYADFIGPVTRIEAFAALDDTSADFTFHWRATGAAERWADAGELEWQLVGRGWEVPIARVRATVALPGGASAEDVRAWGHGPLNGVLTIGPDGTVALSVDDLPPATFVEVHELFPADLLPDAEQIPIEVTPTRLQVEAQMAARANELRAAARAELARQERDARIALVIAGAASAAGVLVWLVIFVRNGREYRPRFRQRYLRDVPAGMPPALVGALWRMGRPAGDSDLTATLLDLAVSGVVRIEPDATPAGRPAKQRRPGQDEHHPPDVRLTLRVERIDAVDELTQPLVDFLFGDVAEEDSLTLAELQSWARRRPARFRGGIGRWSTGVEERARKFGFLETGGGRHMVRAALATGLAAAVVFGMMLWTGPWWLTLPLTALLALMLASRVMRRRSREAAELYAQYRALYRYLRDFGRLQEKPPAAVVLWEQYLVMAAVFGIAEKVVAQMQVRVPEVLQDAGYRDVFWFTSAPWTGAASGGSPFASVTRFSEGLTAAVVAASPQSSGSGSSHSFSGGSSGFSGGGGSGGGGGGGGAD